MKNFKEINNLRNFQKYFNQKILNVSKISHKGNNQIFKLLFENKEQFLLKKYSKIHMDNWKRGKTEFNVLSFLWKKGLREIPKPIYFDDKENIAIYSFEEGILLKPEKISENEINNALNFLIKLHNFKEKDKKLFNPASSACLCFNDYLEVIDRRFKIVSNYKPKNFIERKAKKLLDKKIHPKIIKLKKEFIEKINKENLKKEFPLSEQVLTPADFGFHNILFNDGEYKFIDFEYFGRDDPARQILDFIHHDKSKNINSNLKNKFVEEYIKIRKLSDSFKKRLKLLDPLIGMTWVLIYLNVLSDNYIKHIKFSQGNVKKIIKERIKKAEKKLNELYIIQ